MTTYTDEVNIYNPEAVGDGIDGAAQTATNYITEVSGGGIKVHDANDSSDYVQITSNGMDVYNDGVNVAQFGSDGAQIGAANKSHIELTDKGLNVLEESGDAIAFMGKNKNAVDVTEYIMKNEASQFYTLSHGYVSGSVTVKTASGTSLAFSEGTGKMIRVTGTITGNYIVVSYTSNDEITCFKFGDTDDAAFGEGSFSESMGGAYATNSHAEGLNTKAFGVASHAQNTGTIAAWPSQTAMGKYNVLDPGKSYARQSSGGVVNYYDSKYALIIGNGTADDARSNAFAVAWDGDVELGDTGSHGICAVSDAYLHAARNSATQYRLRLTTAGNLRLDKSTDTGATWSTETYFVKTGQIAAGSVSMSAPKNAYTDVSISFGKTFASAPNVVVGFYSASTSYTYGNVAVSVHTITTTGCKARVFNASATDRTPIIEWIAFG